MYSRDIRRRVWDQLREKDFRVFRELLPPEVILQAARDSAIAIGRGPLNVVNLTWLSVASAVHRFETFTQVLEHTRKLVEDGPHFHGSTLDRVRRAAPATEPRRTHDPRPRDPGSLSEEAFTQARDSSPGASGTLCW